MTPTEILQLIMEGRRTKTITAFLDRLAKHHGLDGFDPRDYYVMYEYAQDAPNFDFTEEKKSIVRLIKAYQATENNAEDRAALGFDEEQIRNSIRGALYKRDLYRRAVATVKAHDHMYRVFHNLYHSPEGARLLNKINAELRAPVTPSMTKKIAAALLAKAKAEARAKADADRIRLARSLDKIREGS